jgi:hypothetical protein
VKHYTHTDDIPEYTGRELSDRVSKVQHVPIEHVNPTEKFDEKRVASIMRAMRSGQQLPALTTEFGYNEKSPEHDALDVVDGHHRLEAARRLGHTHVPVRIKVSADDWNRVKQNGGFAPSFPPSMQKAAPKKAQPNTFAGGTYDKVIHQGDGFTVVSNYRHPDMHHGSPKPIDKLDTKSGTGQFGNGLYLAHDKGIADFHASGQRQGKAGQRAQGTGHTYSGQFHAPVAVLVHDDDAFGRMALDHEPAEEAYQGVGDHLHPKVTRHWGDYAKDYHGAHAVVFSPKDQGVLTPFTQTLAMPGSKFVTHKVAKMAKILTQGHARSSLQKVSSPSKHIPLHRLQQIQRDHHIGAGGKEYSEEEVHHAVNERAEARAGKYVKEATRQKRAPSKRDNPSDWFGKGAQGDWKKEGYTLKHVGTDKDSLGRLVSHLIHAYDKNGAKVGEFEFGGHHMADRIPKGHIVPISVKVDETHRRKGLATEAYKMASAQTGLPVHPSSSQTADAKALWSRGNPGLKKGAAPKLSLVPQQEELVHYSRTPGLKTLDPAKMGTSGVHGAQYKRGIPEHKSTFFYTADSEPEHEVTQGATSRYTFRPGPEHSIYDLTQDRDNLIGQMKERNHGAWNEDLLHSIVKEKGHHGVRWQMRDKTHVVQMYHPTQVHEEHDLSVKPQKLAASEKLGYNGDMGELLTKGFIRNAAIAGMMALAPTGAGAGSSEVPKAAAAPQDAFKAKMLRTIASVESSNGRNTGHETVEAGLNAGHKAYGKYGLMPLTIKDTMLKDPRFKGHNVAPLDETQLGAYMDQNPGLEDQVARAHLKRLRQHFGDDPAKIGYAWLNGVTGTHRALKAGKPIRDHWHVKKILSAFNEKPQNQPAPQARQSFVRAK